MTRVSQNLKSLSIALNYSFAVHQSTSTNAWHSQSIISQYLNNQARKNGWDALEAKLRLWTERVHKRGDDKRPNTTSTAAVTSARTEPSNNEYRSHDEHKDDRWRTDTRHPLHTPSTNTAPQPNEQRSYWDTYSPVKNDGKKSASFTNYSASGPMYGYEMNGHVPSPIEQSYAMHPSFFKPAALTGHLTSNSSANVAGNSNATPASGTSNVVQSTGNSSSIFNSPNVQLPPLVTHGTPYDYSTYPAHMFRQPFPPQINYGPMQPVGGYAYLAQGFTPMPAYPIPSPQSNFTLAPPLAPSAASSSSHFQRPDEYYNHTNTNNNTNNTQNRK